MPVHIIKGGYANSYLIEDGNSFVAVDVGTSSAAKKIYHYLSDRSIDAHYYAILGFSLACGFKRDPALLLAHASQFVDDARINHIVIGGDPRGIHHDIIDKEPCFLNMATCHSYARVKTFNYSFMTGNTTPFHFVPGLKGKNFPKKLRCAEES